MQTNPRFTKKFEIKEQHPDKRELLPSARDTTRVKKKLQWHYMKERPLDYFLFADLPQIHFFVPERVTNQFLKVLFHQCSTQLDEMNFYCFASIIKVCF